MMNYRDLYLDTLLFGAPAKIPFMPGGPRESTLRHWHQQGLPEGADYWETLQQELDVSLFSGYLAYAPIDSRMRPLFEEKVLEHRAGHYIVQDWMGAITEISDTYDYTYLRNPKDFVTRKWHKFPVETRADWERMQERFCVDTLGRLPDDLTEWAAGIDRRQTLVSLSVNGPFWQLREWCGFENLCMLFLDDPAWVREMVDFWRDFVSGLLSRVLSITCIDRVTISEDMAYKAHSMISPAMTRAFLLPTYAHWAEQLYAAGCRIIDMDSDGDIGELIPIWIEAGINVCNPIEVAAHNDLPAFRRQFGRKMAFTGGVDKRAIAAGGSILDAELARLTPVIRDGGYLPGCDHGVPSDVSWPNFLSYCRALATLCRWR